MMRGEIVERDTILASKHQQVGRTLGRAERDARTRPFQQEVGYDGRPMHHPLDAAARGAERFDCMLDAAALVFGRAEHLADLDAPVAAHRDEIRERSADIDADGGTHQSGRRRRTM
jgi:hypothetical protein